MSKVYQNAYARLPFYHLAGTRVSPRSILVKSTFDHLHNSTLYHKASPKVHQLHLYKSFLHHQVGHSFDGHSMLL